MITFPKIWAESKALMMPLSFELLLPGAGTVLHCCQAGRVDVFRSSLELKR